MFAAQALRDARVRRVLPLASVQRLRNRQRYRGPGRDRPVYVMRGTGASLIRETCPSRTLPLRISHNAAVCVQVKVAQQIAPIQVTIEYEKILAKLNSPFLLRSALCGRRTGRGGRAPPSPSSAPSSPPLQS